jgi:hypothetical protein
MEYLLLKCYFLNHSALDSGVGAGVVGAGAPPV